MPSLNRVMLIGHLTRDPSSKQLPSNSTVCEFGMAVNRKYRTQAGEDREEVTFVDCAAFGKQAEVIQQYCQKGKPLYVEGRLKLDSWDDKNGGGKRSKLSVVVENFQFLGAPQGTQSTDDQSPPARQQRQQRQQQTNHRGSGRREMDYDERPQREADIAF